MKPDETLEWAHEQRRYLQEVYPLSLLPKCKQHSNTPWTQNSSWIHHAQGNSKGVKLNLTSITNSPQKPHFQFEPDLDSNTVRRKLCSKKLNNQETRTTKKPYCILPYGGTSLYQLILYVENNIEGKGKIRQSQYFSLSLLVSNPQVESIGIMCLY